MDRLLPGQALQVGGALESPNRWLKVDLENDGDVVLRRVQTNDGLSISKTAGQPVTQVTMRTDGDLVASGATGIQYWHSETAGNAGAYAILHDSGVFVIYDSNGSQLQTHGTEIDWDRPTIAYLDDNGYSYVETAERWKQNCEELPCFDALKWTGYDSTHVDMEINGEPVVIQLWQGWCQKFLGLQEFPGGIGAEVGVYRRVPGRRRPTSYPFLPRLWQEMVLQGLTDLHDRDLWWPAPELNTQLEFELVNTTSNRALFVAGPQKTYWLAKWMDEPSYVEYIQDIGLGLALPQYTLRYSINGQMRDWIVPTWKPVITVRDSLAQALRDGRRQLFNLFRRPWR
jgi:hypothetical protein